MAPNPPSAQRKCPHTWLTPVHSIGQADFIFIAGPNWATVGKPALQQHTPEAFHDPAVLNQVIKKKKKKKQFMQLLFLHLKENSEDLRSGQEPRTAYRKKIEVCILRGHQASYNTGCAVRWNNILGPLTCLSRSYLCM